MSFIDRFLAKRGKDGATMAFTDHIEELRWCIIKSLVAVVIVSSGIYFKIEWIFTNVILGPANAKFISYKILTRLSTITHIDAWRMTSLKIKFQSPELSGQFMTGFSAAFLIGFIIAFPYVFWQFWKFVKPALKQSEVKHAKGIVFWSSMLFFAGVFFAYFIVAPFTINFFANYQLSPQFENIITIENYCGTMCNMILGIGVLFELPVLVYFLSKVGVLTPTFMRTYRRYAIIIIMIVAAIIAPPDFFSVFLVAIPLALLYEAGIIISSNVVKEKKKQEKLDW